MSTDFFSDICKKERSSARLNIYLLFNVVGDLLECFAVQCSGKKVKVANLELPRDKTRKTHLSRAMNLMYNLL